MTVDKFVEHAVREQERYSYRGLPMPSVSVDATVEGWTLDAILRDRLWSRSSYATTLVGALWTADYELVPTFEVPHYDVLLPAADADAADRLLSLFGSAQRNEYHRRR